MEKVFEKYFKGDRIVWAVVIMLTIFSILAVYSSTGTLAFTKQQGNTFYYILKHFSILFMGLVIIYITHLIPYKFYSRLSQLLLLISIPLLILTLFLGKSINDASRWLVLPGIGLTFQTSDLAKLALIMYLARQLSMKQNNIKDLKGAFLPVILPVVLICLLIIPADFSTGAILMFTSVVLMFIGRISIKHIALLSLIGAVCIALFVLASLALNKSGRIETWKNRIEYYMSGETDGNYQVEQAKIAIAKGGLVKMAPGKSTQRNFLPQAYSDFIYAIIIEEYGMVGGIFVMFLYLFLLYRAGMIVKKCTRTFPAFLAIGLTLMIVIQALVNMAVAVNLFPVTGQTLPLISMGGTSLLFTCIALGIILSISRSNNLEMATITENNETQE
jgi:cell division protein FtsW